MRLNIRQKRFVLVFGLLLAGVIALGLWAASRHLERKRESAAIRGQLPRLPETAGWPPAFAQALQSAMDAVAGREGGAEGLEELAMLFHANALMDEAGTCYSLLRSKDPDEPRWAYFLADVRLNEGDLESAETLLAQVVAAEPTYLPAHLRLGEAYFKSGKPDKARESYANALRLNLDDRDALLGLARADLQLGNDDDAFDSLGRLVESNRQFAPGYALMARLLEKKGAVDKARIARLTAEKHGRQYRDPPDPWLDDLITRCYDLKRLGVLADMNAAARRFEQALTILDHAESVSPGDSEVRLIRASAYTGAGDTEAAIATYRQSLDLGADPASVYPTLAALYERMGDIATATRTARTGLEKSPESFDILTTLGTLLVEQDRRAEAKVHLRKALELAPSHLPALRALARAQWEDGRERQSMELFQEARRHSPLDFQSRAFLAQYYMEKGDLDSAEAPLREALELEPDNEDLRGLNLVYLQQSGNRKARDGDLLGAAADFAEALANDPDNVELFHNLGVVYANLGNLPAAIDNLAAYTDTRPEDADAWILLGDVVWETAAHNTARKHWETAAIVARGSQNSREIIAAVEKRLSRPVPNH